MATQQQIADRLRRLERDNGRLLPSDVVEDARNPRSPLHPYFEWDDGAAAKRYRVQQAARLIRTVRIEVTVHQVPLTANAYVREPTANVRDRGYRSVVSLRSEEDAARAAIVDAMVRVNNAVRQAKTLAASLGFVDDIDKIETLAQSIIGRAQNLDDAPLGTA